MQIIKSITDIKKNIHEIATICRTNDSPVYITKNGKVDLALMSIAHYKKLLVKCNLCEKLFIAQTQAMKGEKGITHNQLMKKIRKNINAC